MNKEEKLAKFKEEFPGFIQKVYDYNQNMMLFGLNDDYVIDDIGHIQMCKDFYYKFEDVIPKTSSPDVWSFVEDMNRCCDSLYRSWHPNERGIRLSPMFVKNVLLK